MVEGLVPQPPVWVLKGKLVQVFIGGRLGAKLIGPVIKKVGKRSLWQRNLMLKNY
jgi:hypothetical protein